MGFWDGRQLDHMQTICTLLQTDNHTNTHTHTHPFNGPFSGTTRVGRYQKGKTNLDFTEARDSEWQWHQLGICKSAPRSRQITMPASHHSVFYRPDALPAAQPTVSKHWRQKLITVTNQNKKLHFIWTKYYSQLYYFQYLFNQPSTPGWTGPPRNNWTSFFNDWMPFLLPNQQCQSTQENLVDLK